MGFYNWQIEELEAEYNKATGKYHPFSSAHEGYAIILEELDELKAEVFKKQENRTNEEMRHEAIQVAAMAMRFIFDICLKAPAR